MKIWSDRGSTCKFRNARSAFRNLHVDPLSLHTFMRNKQVEFNPYIYTLTTLSKLYRFGYEISVFNTKHPVIILWVSLFAVTPSHVASSKNECQNFSYVHRSRKHWECKYYLIYTSTTNKAWELFAYCPKYRPRFFERTEEMQRCLQPFVAEKELIKTKLYKETNSAESLLRSIRRACEP